MVSGVTRLAAVAAGIAMLTTTVGSAASATAQETSPAWVQNARWRTSAVEAGLDGAVRAAVTGGGVVWVGYEVEGIDRGAGMCCFTNDDADHTRCGTCWLEGGQRNSGYVRHGDDHVDLEADSRMRVMLRFDDGRLDRVRGFSSACTLDAGGSQVVWLRGVTAAASVAWLVPQASVSGPGSRHYDGRDVVGVVAAHRGAEAHRSVERWATTVGDPLREHAVFWLGAARPEQGWPLIERLLQDDSDPDIREKAAFAAYVSKVPAAIDVLVRSARSDGSARVRGAALMWLGHLAGERAVAAIDNALKHDPETEVKRRAVFALGQLPPERGVPLLIQIATTNPNREVRKAAFFWLGQSGDARALELIERILSG